MTENNIWSAILKTASLSKRVHTKNVLILGDASSGKSTLVHHLKHEQKGEINNQHDQPDSFIRTVANGGYVKSVKQDLDVEATKMLGLGYTSATVHDEHDEPTLRLGIYQLGHAQHIPLLDPVLRDDNLFCIIVLDWTKPWTFVETLQRWLSVLEQFLAKVTTNASKARVEDYLQKYEPVSEPSNVDAHAAAAEAHADLAQGSLTINLGVPIAVVCCKSDTQKMLEEKYGYDEAQLDYIQQTLRCICMKYGASLFYTSTLHPLTYSDLRQYIVHRSNEDPEGSSFQKAHFVEPMCVLIPAGWDTWNKIKALEESYHCEEMSMAWDARTTALSIYREAVPEPNHEKVDHVIQPAVSSEDEQALYAKYFQPSSRAPPPPPLSTTFMREWVRPEQQQQQQQQPPFYAKQSLHTSSPIHPLDNAATSYHGKSPTTTSSASSAAASTTTATTTTPSASSGMTKSSMDLGSPPASTEILNQFFKSLLCKNLESPTSGSDDRRSRSSVDSSMHNRPSCVNTT